MTMKHLKTFNEKISQSEIDRLLDKISSNGIESLTDRERQELDNADNPNFKYKEEPNQPTPIKQSKPNTPNGKFGFKIVDTFGDGEGYDANFYVGIFHNDGSDTMVDWHISEEYDFPDDMEEEVEGTLGYYGDLTKDEMRSKLVDMGFSDMDLETN